jgi:hypothetical protein
MPDTPSPAAFDAVKSLLDSPVAFHPAFARVAGGVTGGVFLSQLCYWARTMDKRAEAGNRDPTGRLSVEFWKSLGEWSEETALSPKELRAARSRLEVLGVVVSRLDRVRHRLWWRVDYGRLAELLSEGEYLPKGQVPPAQKADATGRKGKSIYEMAETTAETTAENGAAVSKPRSFLDTGRARGDAVAAIGGPARPLPGADPDPDPPPAGPGGRGGRPASPPAPLAPAMAQAAGAAGVPAGIVAGQLLEHPGRESELLGWLVSLGRRRARFRAPAAMLRWAMLRGLSPPGQDHDQGKREARGGDLAPARGSLFQRRAVLAIRAAAAEIGARTRAAEAGIPAAVWRVARARCEERIQADRREATLRLRRLLPALSGGQRQRALELLGRTA